MPNPADAEHPHVEDCPFCGIARGTLPAVVLHEDEDLVAFLDIAPVRAGHTQIIPRAHVKTVELLPQALATRILVLGQQLARRMKEAYGVQRVAFLFTGSGVAHAHAHVIPMHHETDVTSARYLVHPADAAWSSAHLHADRDTLLRVREALAFSPPRQ